MAEVFWLRRSHQVDNDAYRRAVEELVNIDFLTGRVRTQITGTFSDDLTAYFVADSALSHSHWSRRFEWPWALLATPITKKDVVLEAGGGDCAFQFYLARRADHVVNLDHSQAALDRAELVARRLGQNNLLCRQGDLMKIPYPDGHFTRVFCISVIEHTPDPGRCLDELRRVTAPGGHLVVTIDVANKANPNCLVDADGARALLARIGVEMPPMPEDAIARVFKDAYDYTLAVLCLHHEVK